MKWKDIYDDIDWKSLIFGSAFCTVLAMIGSSPGLGFLIPFSAIGLLWVGYEGKNFVWGTILGAIAAMPLFLVAVYGGLGELTPTGDMSNLIVLIFIACLAIGALTGFVGSYFHKNRDEAIEMKEKDLKKGKRNKK